MTPAAAWRFALGFWGGMFVALPMLVAWHDTRGSRLDVPIPRVAASNSRPLPPVDPVQVRHIAPENARAINAAIPFSRAPNPAARPFRFAGNGEDRARATACLAAAQYYEAGDDAQGQEAVAQVVLNRVRHPAFPKSVCGVVFQGAERVTGCQFTFTCDGAMHARTPSPDAWNRAQQIAARMLSGHVYGRVGYATHYHTDWVVPYWSGSLDKVSAVRTHLFFRWPGYWGTPGAFAERSHDPEPSVPVLATLAPVHGVRGALTLDLGVPSAPMAAQGVAELASAPMLYRPDAPARAHVAGVRLLASAPDATAFLIEVPAALPAGAQADIARTYCSGRPQCRIMAWSAPDPLPTRFPPDPASLDTMRFSYIHDARNALQRMLWNCARSPAPAGVACMRGRAATPLTASQTSPPAKP